MANNVIRGGGWIGAGGLARSAYRDHDDHAYRLPDLGFRLVLNSPSPPGKSVVRGGSWYDPQAAARAAFRLRFPPASRLRSLGFRLGLEAPAPGCAG